MYDVRLQSSRALRGGERSRRERNTVKPCTDIVTKERWRLAEPMYDLRCTMYDLGSSRALRGGERSRREEYGETMHGHNYKGAVALGRAYVRCGMYDLGNSRALRGGERSRRERNTVKPCTDIVTKGRWRLAEPMYDVGCTMYNTHDGPKQLRGSCSCTMCDVRCTIAKFARVARGFLIRIDNDIS